MQKILRVGLPVFLALLIIASWLAPLDSVAINQIDTGLQRATITYAGARALNAVISVVQGTEVSIEPGGVGVNFAPGQALAPINELVEQFSTLMLIASISFGIQKILVSIGGYWLISLVLTFAAAGWGWFHYKQQKSPAWITKLLVILLMVRFAIPIVTLGTDLLFQKFMSADYQVSNQVISAAPAQVSELNAPAPPPPENTGMWDSFKEKASGLWAQARSATDAKEHFTRLKVTGEQWATHIIKLIVIFLLQTLIIPVLLLWVLYAVVRGTFEIPTKKSSKPEDVSLVKAVSHE